MPFIIRTTFAFAGLEQGWSESFYWQQSTDNLATAETTVTPIAQKRARLLAADYTLTIGRNTVVEEVGVGKVLRRSDIFEPRLRGVTAWTEPAQPNEALMCLWQTGDNTKSKIQYMRGLPSGVTDTGKTPVLGFGTFLSNFNAWRESLVFIAAGWLTTAPTQTRTIETYTTVQQSGIVSFVFGAPGFVWPVLPGQRTRIYIKLPGKSPLDGPLIVVPSDATHAMTANPIGVAPQIPGQIGSASIRGSSLVTLAPAAPGSPAGMIHPQRMVTHKTGRPSYASRGRAPVKIVW